MGPELIVIGSVLDIAYIYRECEWWVAQCLEYDIAVQATSIQDVQYEIQRVLFGRICTAKKLGIDPFEGLPPAPPHYHKILQDQKGKILTMELNPIKNLSMKIPQKFAIPKQAFLYA